MNIEFVEFVETPGEKHVGIVTVNFNNMLYLRYKVMPSQKGPGYYCNPPSYKINRYGTDEYMQAIVIDSNFAKEKIDRIVRDEVTKYFAHKSDPRPFSSTISSSVAPSALTDDCPF